MTRKQKEYVLGAVSIIFYKVFDLPKLKEQETKNLEQPLSEKKFQSALQNMPNEKYQVMMALQKSFMKHFGTI